ncbi:hypothetical protein Peur_016900 [Populus x canadensis]
MTSPVRYSCLGLEDFGHPYLSNLTNFTRVRYLVQITNTYPQVPIADIHLNCKDFSSAILVSPETFRRIAVDDCLVNDGRALAPGAAYANTKQYPLPHVKSSVEFFLVLCGFSTVASQALLLSSFQSIRSI